MTAAADAGIHCISIPTPFLVGRVNLWLIEDEPLTLVDTGPNSGTSLDELEQALMHLGHRIEDLELIVITHQHVDHTGLLRVIVRRSGAEVAALDLLGPYLEDYSASAAADDAFAMRVMLRHGVPADLATALGAVGSAFRAFGSAAPVTRPLRDGGRLVLRDRTLRVAHRPGHSPSDTIFFDERRRILIAGDHLLATISSNPLISRPPHAAQPADAPDEDERSPSLLNYLRSMRATRDMPAQLVLTGHGPPVTDHVALIDERLRMHERRSGKIRRMLAPGPLTAFELASQMWGNVAISQAFLTLSEVLGHLDLLIADRAVAEDSSGPVTRFVAL